MPVLCHHDLVSRGHDSVMNVDQLYFKMLTAQVANFLSTVVYVCVIASLSQRVSLIGIPFCLSGCVSVIPRPTAYHD